MPTNTELDALLSRVREMRTNAAYPHRNAVAYDCYRMFEDLATRFKEEFTMRDRYKRQSNAWRDKALKLAALLAEVDAIDDGDTPLCWQHTGLFERIHAEITGVDLPHASDCSHWVGEPCNCVTGRPDVAPYDWQGQDEL